MNDIERIQQYIDNTKGETHRYQINLRELWVLKNGALENPVEMLCLAFNYGRAKGYRAAKAEGRGWMK